MEDLTGFQRDLLRTVAKLGTPNGLEIKDELIETGMYRDINHGRLYPNLDTLVSKGLIRKQARDKRSNEYLLSRRGRNEVKNQSAEWQKAAEAA